MSARWKKDRTQLLAWAHEKQKTNEEQDNNLIFGVSRGNLLTVAGVSLVAVASLYYYTSSTTESIESQLGAVDEEIDVEEYLVSDSESESG